MRKEITISGTIGEDYTILDLINDLQDLEDYEGLDIVIDSPGGYVSTGYAIAERLQEIKNVRTIAKRVYSIATVIFLAGSERIVNEGSVFLIHNPYGTNIEGDKNQLRQIANSLEDTEKDLEAFYQSKTGIDSKILSALMEEQTFFNGEKALMLGFATKKEDSEIIGYSKGFKAVAFLREVNQSYNDYPQDAAKNADKALRFKESHPDMKCGTRVGWARANQLAKNENISIDTVSRIASFARFERFAGGDYVDNEGQYNCGAIMYDAWGGKAAIDWAQNKLKEVKNVFTNKSDYMELVKSLENLIGKFKNQEAVAMDDTEEVIEEVAMEEEEVKDDAKAMLSDDEMNSIVDAVVSRIMEVMKPEMESLQDEALALQKATTEAQTKATERVLSLAETIETTWKPEGVKVFNSAQEKEVELTPKEEMKKLLREKTAKRKQLN